MGNRSEELLRKIHLGEDSTLELKEVGFRGDRVSSPRRSDLADEVAALANSKTGGDLILGVADRKREVVGIPLEKLDAVEGLIVEICQDSVQPPVSCLTFRHELADETGELKPVLQVRIDPSLFVHKSPGGYFRRQGSSKREMPPDLLARLFQERSQARLLRFEEQAVPETGLVDLDEGLWRRFLDQEAGDPEATLRKMGILVPDSRGEERVSVAGVLLASREPDRWLPGAFIEAVQYRGFLQDSNYQIDHRQIRGPLDRQILEALAFVQRNMRIGARKVPGRIDIPGFDLRAVFEAVVNAVAHRDYSVPGSKVRLFLFDDRLEIYSPGALPNTLTVESLPLRQVTRNELITSLLNRCSVGEASKTLDRQQFMEKRGDGVPIILAASQELSGREPVYRLIDDAELMLTIWVADPQGVFRRDSEDPD